MILSTTTTPVFDTFGFEAGIQLLAKLGFDALDLNLVHIIYDEEFSEENYKNTCSMLKKRAEENNIYFNQAHAPHPSYRFGDDDYNEKVKPALIRSVKAAGLVGAKQIVVHPTACPEGVDQKKFNLDFYNTLTPYAKEFQIKIALENMWGFDSVQDKIVPNVCSFGRELADCFDALDPEYFTVCLDVGHSGLVGQSAEAAIFELGGQRLHALHIHDNDNVKDLHTIPYQGKINWDAVMTALKCIDYDGDFTYEIDGHFLSAYRTEPELMVKALELMAATGRKLIAKFDNAL